MSEQTGPWPEAFSSEGAHVRLELLDQRHAADLAEAAGALGELWYTMIPTPEGVPAEIERRLKLHAAGAMLPFAVIERASGKAVGMTTYMNIEAAHSRLEIGSTWMSPDVQRGALNTECKLLLLTHAFEVLDCIAVEFRTHAMNVQSRRAIERLGAKFDGVLRAHMKMANGTLRDSAVYSITAPDWPAVKANLSWQLQKPR